MNDTSDKPPATGSSQSQHLLRRIMRNAGWLFSAKGFASIAGLLYLALASRSLGSEQLGLLILIHSLVVAVREVTSFKSWQVLISYGTRYLESDDRSKLRSLLRLTTSLDVAGAVMGLGVGLIVVHAFAGQLEMNEEIQSLAAIYCLTSLIALKSTPVGILRLFNRFDTLARHALVVPVARTFGALICWHFNLGLEWFVVVWFIADIASSLTILLLSQAEVRRQGIFVGAEWFVRLRADDHPGIWPFIWWANFQATAAAANSHIPVLLSGGLISPAAAAFVKLSQEISAILTKPATVLADVLYPELARLIARSEVAATKQLILRSFLSITPIAALIIGIMTVFAESILAGLFGSEYGTAALLLSLILIGAGIQAVSFVFEPALYSMAKAKTVFGVKSLATLVQIGIIFVFGATYGMEMVGYAAICYALLAGTTLGFFALRDINRLGRRQGSE